jgi:hypothetical protein
VTAYAYSTWALITMNLVKWLHYFNAGRFFLVQQEMLTGRCRLGQHFAALTVLHLIFLDLFCNLVAAYCYEVVDDPYRRAQNFWMFLTL